MFTPTTPTSRAFGHELLAVTAENEISVGSSESAPKVWQVKPTGPSGVAAVTTATPVTKCPSTSLKLRDVDGTHDDETTDGPSSPSDSPTGSSPLRLHESPAAFHETVGHQSVDQRRATIEVDARPWHARSCLHRAWPFAQRRE